MNATSDFDQMLRRAAGYGPPPVQLTDDQRNVAEHLGVPEHRLADVDNSTAASFLDSARAIADEERPDPADFDGGARDTPAAAPDFNQMIRDHHAANRGWTGY